MNKFPSYYLYDNSSNKIKSRKTNEKESHIESKTKNSSVHSTLSMNHSKQTRQEISPLTLIEPHRS